jgi:3-phenylpropionate/cinnamic acid dioxygenase small subunit
MITQSFDTHPEAERVQIALIRKAGIARRIGIARSLSETAIKLSRRAISRANPQLSEQELNLVIVAHNYGSYIADRLGNYLKRKKLW